MTHGTTPISDDDMRAGVADTRTYTLVLLKAGDNYGTPEATPVVWEHARRNFALRAEGVLPIVCPVADDTELCGIGIFDAPVDEVVGIMDGDPGVAAGIFTYETHPVRGFPGSVLP